MKRLISFLLHAHLMAALWVPLLSFAGVLAVTGANDSPLNVPVVLIFATLFISTMAGAATLASRVQSELLAKGSISTPWLYCASHMLGSWCSGAFAFLISMQRGADVWVLLGAVLVFSFGGAKLLEKGIDMWVRKQ